jgi:hypothetical protein
VERVLIQPVAAIAEIAREEGRAGGEPGAIESRAEASSLEATAVAAETPG